MRETERNPIDVGTLATCATTVILRRTGLAIVSNVMGLIILRILAFLASIASSVRNSVMSLHIVWDHPSVQLCSGVRPGIRGINSVMRILQANLNHHWTAQNLLVQNMSEFQLDIACVSEPVVVPRNSQWFSSVDGNAAIYVEAKTLRGRCSLNKAGRNFVAISCERYNLFSVYIAPSESNEDFHTTLDELSAAVHHLGDNHIITGDFNAKSALWGCARTDWRGSVIERWAAELDLVLINNGVVSTCVRSNGESIIDLTWSSAGVCGLLSDWRVLSDEVLSLSDHRYIVFRIGGAYPGHAGGRALYPRWNTKTLDRDLFVETLDWLGVGNFPRESVEDFSSAAFRFTHNTHRSHNQC